MKFKCLIFVGIYFIIISQDIIASEQYPDVLIYNGKEYEIGVFPMESYFIIYPTRRPGITGINSALYRGYRAKYQIINNELILIDIEIMRNGNWRSLINRKYFRNRIKINTYTGKINLFNGNNTGVYMAFTPIYENYIIIEINEGNIENIYNISCYEYIESIMNKYSNDSYVYEYFNGLLVELNRR
jgi:hypothetical protein